MVQNTKTTIEYKDGLLITTEEYPKRDLELSVGGTKYVVGWDGPNKITQTVTKDNIPFLLDYLKEQFALINGRYEEAKKQLAQIGDFQPKLAEVMEGHAQAIAACTSQKEREKLLRRVPAYGEMIEKVLRSNNLKKTIADLEPSVRRLKEQIEEVLAIVEKHKIG